MARLSSPARRYRSRLPRLSVQRARHGRRLSMNPNRTLAPPGWYDAGEAAPTWPTCAPSRLIPACSLSCSAACARRSRRRGPGRRRGCLGCNGFGCGRCATSTVFRRRHRIGTSSRRPRHCTAFRAVAGSTGPWAGARGSQRRAALWPRARPAATHRCGRAREQLRVTHGAGRYRYDGVRQVRSAGLARGVVRERRYPACNTC